MIVALPPIRPIITDVTTLFAGTTKISTIQFPTGLASKTIRVQQFEQYKVAGSSANHQPTIGNVAAFVAASKNEKWKSSSLGYAVPQRYYGMSLIITLDANARLYVFHGGDNATVDHQVYCILWYEEVAGQ